MSTDMDTGMRIDVEGVDVQKPGKALLTKDRVATSSASPRTIS